MRQRNLSVESKRKPAHHRVLSRSLHPLFSQRCLEVNQRMVCDWQRPRSFVECRSSDHRPRDLHATQPASEQTSVGAERARSRRGRGPADRTLGRGGSRGAGRAGERAPGGAAVPAAGRPRHRWLAGREGFFYRKGRGRICKVPESPPTVLDRAKTTQRAMVYWRCNASQAAPRRGVQAVP